MKKIIFEAAVIGTILLSSVTGAHAAGCGAKSVTKVGVLNSNVLFANQTQVSTNNTGFNFAFGNIGGAAILPGSATSTSNQNIVANQNNTTIGIAGTPVSNTTNVINTGNFVAICN